MAGLTWVTLKASRRKWIALYRWRRGWKGQSIGAWNSFLNLVEDANGAVENALRLSAYKHARDAGLSRQQAASLLKHDGEL